MAKLNVKVSMSAVFYRFKAKWYTGIVFWIFISISACNCNPNGTVSCAKIGGFCKCKPEFSGNDCRTCEDGYYQTNINEMITCTGE